MRTRVLTLVFALAVAGTAGAQAPASPPGGSPPAYGAAIHAALEKAREENLRVLVQWGTEDEASKGFTLVSKKDRDLAKTLLYEYEVVRQAVASPAALPAEYRAKSGTADLPYLTVLDSKGTLLAARSATEFRDPAEKTALVFDTKRLDAFFLEFKPEYVKAEPLLTEALRQAKQEQKHLFLWFSAPW